MYVCTLNTLPNKANKPNTEHSTHSIDKISNGNTNERLYLKSCLPVHTVHTVQNIQHSIPYTI